MRTCAVSELNRMSICPLLAENEWDYSVPPEIDPCFLYGFKESLRWLYRRGNPITPSTVLTSMNQYNLRKGDLFGNHEAEKAVRTFITDNSYNDLEKPFYNYKIEMKLNDQIHLEHTVLTMAKRKKKLCFITVSKEEVASDIYMQTYETMFATLWAYNRLNEVPVFHNFYMKDGEVKEQTLKTSEEYISEATRRLIAIGRKVGYPSALPSWEVCIHCSRRKECLQTMKKNKRQK